MKSYLTDWSSHTDYFFKWSCTAQWKTELASLSWSKTFGVTQNWVQTSPLPFLAWCPRRWISSLWDPASINRRGKNSSKILWSRIGEKTHGKEHWHSDLSIDNCSLPSSMPLGGGALTRKRKRTNHLQNRVCLVSLQRKVLLKDTVRDPLWQSSWYTE